MGFEFDSGANVHASLQCDQNRYTLAENRFTKPHFELTVRKRDLLRSLCSKGNADRQFSLFFTVGIRKIGSTILDFSE